MKRTITKLMAALVIGIGVIGGASAVEAQEKEWVKISDMPDKNGGFHTDIHSLCRAMQGPYGIYANEYGVYDNITARCKLEQPAFPHNYPAAIACHLHTEGSFSWDRPDGCYVFKVPEPEPEECPEGTIPNPNPSTEGAEQCVPAPKPECPKVHIVDGAFGLVACNGADDWIPCAYTDYSIVGTDVIAKEIINDCTKEHEQSHIDNRDRYGSRCDTTVGVTGIMETKPEPCLILSEIN